MRQWDIFLFPFSVESTHPAVIISPDERCQNTAYDRVNALICTTVRLSRPPKPNESVLDEVDGLDWKTAVKCDLVYAPDKSEFLGRRGRVSEPRRAELARKLFSVLRLPLH